jgi:hypothetical protein
LTCDDGFALVGANGTAPVCQKLFQKGSQGQLPESVCPAQKMALDNLAPAAVTCTDVPTLDLVPLCRSGFYLKAKGQNNFSCEPIPSADPAYFNGTCGVGRYLSGFAAGQPVCLLRSDIGTLPTQCPFGYFPLALSNGSVVCYPYLPGSGAQCIPGSQALCAIQNGLGVHSCNAQGSAYDAACTLLNCNPGATQVGNSCERVQCQPGASQLCLVDNGVGLETCGADRQFGLCLAKSCSQGFKVVGDKCVASTCIPGTVMPCRDAGGSGLRICNAGGDSYSNSCLLTSCDNGYSLIGGVCKDTTAPRITMTKIPSGLPTSADHVVEFLAVDTQSGIDKVECSIDGGVYSACVSPKVYTGLTRGVHEMRIRATDKSGNVTIENVVWGTKLCLPGSKMNCVIPHGLGAMQTCAADGGAYGACLAESCDSGYALVAGACVVVQDITGPVIAVSSKPSNLPATSPHVVVFTATDAGSGIASVMCSLDGAAYAACSSPVTYNGLAAGHHILDIKAVDRAGNATMQRVEWDTRVCAPSSSAACPIANGVGAKVCLATGASYGACAVVSCGSGFVSNGVTCVRKKHSHHGHGHDRGDHRGCDD